MVLRTILLALHIISAGVWFSQFPLHFILNGIQKRLAGTPGEQTATMVKGQLLGGLGQIGGLGILVTGLGLIILEGYGFLGIGGATPAWLFIKQIIYVIALVLVFVVIQPAGKRAAAAMQQAAQTGGPLSPEARAASARAEQLSLLLNLLVFVNIILAVWKPV